MKNNTVVTIGDDRYAWGIFMLIASMRQNGMDEPVLVGGKNFTKHTCQVLQQLGDVEIYKLTNVDSSLTCYKPLVMLEASTEYLTWADSDGFFKGNCSQRLIPLSPDEIHIRNREPKENQLAFRSYEYGEDGRSIPRKILEAWKHDVGEGEQPALQTSCSACFMSLHRSHRDFLKRWLQQMRERLPRRDVGVTDRTLRYYHQLDESVLNSVLCFAHSAPKISDTYRLDKDPSQLFVHFVGQPKPWQGWVRQSLRHYDAYLEVLDFVQSQQYELPGPLPWCLERSHRFLSHLLALPLEIRQKAKKRLRRVLNRGL